MTISNHLKGTLLCIIGVIVLNPDALLLRSVSSVPNYSVLFIKFAFYTLSFSIYFLWRWKQQVIAKFAALKLFGFAAGVVWGLCNACFVLAIQHVFVANVLVICAGNSIFSAFVSRVFIGELIPLRTIVTCFVCFGAIVLVFAGEIGGDSTADSTLGNILALVASVSMGVYFSMLRHVELTRPKEDEPVDMVACNIIAGVFVCILALGLGGPPSVEISPLDSFLLWLQGGLLNPISFGLLTIGPAYITAPEVSLYTLLVTIFGPVWVYLGGYEKPPMMSIYGGIIIVVSLAANSALAFRELKKQSIHPSSAILELELETGKDGKDNLSKTLSDKGIDKRVLTNIDNVDNDVQDFEMGVFVDNEEV